LQIAKPAVMLEMPAVKLVALIELLVERLVVSPGMHSEILADKPLVAHEAPERLLCLRFSPELASGHLKSPVSGWTSLLDVVIDPCSGREACQINGNLLPVRV
jgi:hypothetical protein